MTDLFFVITLQGIEISFANYLEAAGNYTLFQIIFLIPLDLWVITLGPWIITLGPWVIMLGPWVITYND